MANFRQMAREVVRPERVWGRVYRLCLGLGMVGVTSALGCGTGIDPTPRTFPVSGKVVLSNGQPLTAGRIAFVPKDVLSLPASGEIERDGSFHLTTKTDGDGAIPGEYKIRIEPAAPGTERKRSTRPSFPVKYIDEDSSGLRVTVRAEANQLKPISLK